MKTKLFSSLLLAMILAFGFSAPFFTVKGAESSDSVKISPVTIEELVKPGQVLSFAVKVTNSANIPKTLYPMLRDFKAGDETGNPQLIKPGSEEGSYLASWIDVINDGVDFAPGEEKTIPFFVRVPNDAGPGGYYGALYFGTQANKLKMQSEDKGAGMSVAYQAGTLLLLRVEGTVLESAMIRDFYADKSVYNTPFKVDFTIRVENSGNVHIKPLGQIEVKNMFGKTVLKKGFNEGGGNVLPKSIRKFGHSWEGKMAFGKYDASLCFSYGVSEKQGGQGQQSVCQDTSFWIVPWKIVASVAISLILVFLLFSWLLKSVKNKAVKRAMERAGIMHQHVASRAGVNDESDVNYGVTILVFVIGAAILSVIIYFVIFA